MDLLDETIAISGRGCVGLPLAVEFSTHRPLIGFGIEPQRIGELPAGDSSPSASEAYYLTHKAREVGHHAEVILAGRRINGRRAALR